MKIAIHIILALSMILGLNLNAGAKNYADVLAKPDLLIRVAGPQRANPGEEIGQQIRQQVTNRGEAPAPGMVGRIDPANGYMIDLVISTDQRVPTGFATFSHEFREDALLEGGRTSRTDDLFPGDIREYPVGARIPANTPPGNYFICARIDSGDRVAESNERNNNACFPIQIGQPPPPLVGIGWDNGNGPDLIVSEFSVTPAAPIQGEPVTVRIGVYNQGNQHAGPFTVQWWAGENYPEPAQSWYVDGARAHGGRILTFTYNGYPSWYSQIRTKVVVDATQQVSESEERNNTGIMTISVSRP